MNEVFLARRWQAWLLIAAGVALAIYLLHTPLQVQAASPAKGPGVITSTLYVPAVLQDVACEPIPWITYATLSVNSQPTDIPAEQHADLNLALRGYVPTSAYLGLVDYGGPTDPGAPQLAGLFLDQRTPTFDIAYQVYDWNWSCNCRDQPISEPPVTLIGMGTSPGEILYVPDSGYTIGIGDGYEVLVLYASAERITLKYTREDNVVHGYTLHVESICVEPKLLALYQSWNAAGRKYLPALKTRQPFGRARGSLIGVAIRDTGTFMDPRSRKDWWQGR